MVGCLEGLRDGVDLSIDRCCSYIVRSFGVGKESRGTAKVRETLLESGVFPLPTHYSGI